MCPSSRAVRESLPLSVRQVVELGALDLKGLPPVGEALARVGLRDLSRERFSALSGGQRQRVMVARALHRQPDVLVLDEPTNGVDLLTRHALRHLMRELNGEGVAVLLITHLLGEIGPEVGHFLWLDSREGLFLAGDAGVGAGRLPAPEGLRRRAPGRGRGGRNGAGVDERGGGEPCF